MKGFFVLKKWTIFYIYLIFEVNGLFNERLLVSLEEVVVHIDINGCCSVFAFDDSLLNDKKKQ
jgi:hypothetical protein